MVSACKVVIWITTQGENKNKMRKLKIVAYSKLNSVPPAPKHWSPKANTSECEYIHKQSLLTLFLTKVFKEILKVELDLVDSWLVYF